MQRLRIKRVCYPFGSTSLCTFDAQAVEEGMMPSGFCTSLSLFLLTFLTALLKIGDRRGDIFVRVLIVFFLFQGVKREGHVYTYIYI